MITFELCRGELFISKDPAVDAFINGATVRLYLVYDSHNGHWWLVKKRTREGMEGEVFLDFMIYLQDVIEAMKKEEIKPDIIP